jgi:hypothetical protein
MNPNKFAPNALDPKKFYISGIKRPGFMVDDPLPRNVDFDALALLDINLYGEKVQLSKKTLDELMDVTLPDPLDKTFMMEGRPQRTIKLKYNLADIAKSAADVSTKLEVVKQAIDQNRVSTITEIQNLRDALFQIVKENPGVMNNQPQGSLPIIQQAVQHAGIPKIWNEPGSLFQSRFLTGADLTTSIAPFTTSGGESMEAYTWFYLVANFPAGRDVNNAVLDEARAPPGEAPKLISASVALAELDSNPNFAIDLENRSLIKSTNLVQTPAQSIASNVAPPPPPPPTPPVPSTPAPVSAQAQAGAVATEARNRLIKTILKKANTLLGEPKYKDQVPKAEDFAIKTLNKAMTNPTMKISSAIRSEIDFAQLSDLEKEFLEQIFSEADQRGLGKKKRVRIYKF